jgi:hypothetical protein
MFCLAINSWYKNNDQIIPEKWKKWSDIEHYNLLPLIPAADALQFLV